MKKHISLVIIALALGLSASGKPVTLNQAKIAAGSFLGAQTKASGELTLVWDGTDPATKASGASAPFYVFNRKGGGWVMISGDDTLTPVIGWSDRNEFVVDGMPANVRFAMETIRANCTPRETAGRNKAWAELLSGTKAAIVPATATTCLNTNEWTQETPYNSCYPAGTGVGSAGGRMITGCLPTALSIVIAHHKYAAPSGTLPGFSASPGETPVFSGESYNLSSPARDYKLETLNGLKTNAMVQAASADVKAALAQLTYDCAVAVKAYNSPTLGTGAHISDVIKPFGEHMGYNKAAKILHADSYSVSEWTTMLKAQITAGNPVIIVGQDEVKGGGHFYIFDGFGTTDGATSFHVNFGWAGSSNGYYVYSYLLTDNGGYNPSSDQIALIDFTPDKTGTSSFGINLELNHYGLYYNEDKTKVMAEKVYNNGYSDATDLYMGLFKVDKNGNRAAEPEYYYSAGVTIPAQSSIVFTDDAFNLTTPKNTWQFGDTFVLYYSTDHGTSWVRLPAPRTPDIVSQLPAVGGPYIKVPATIKAGELFSLEVANVEFAAKCTSADSCWEIDGNKYPIYTKEFLISNPGKHTIKVNLDPTDYPGNYFRSITTTVNVQ